MPDVLLPLGNAGQHAQLKLAEQLDGTHALAVAVVAGGGGGGGGADREIVVTTYRATQNGTGYSTGNVISASRVLDVSGASATQVGATLWFNETTGLALAGAPTSGHLEVAGQPGLTDAQLRAAAVSVSVPGLPTALGPRVASQSTSVTSSTVAAASSEARVAAVLTSTTILAANPNRRRVVIVNDSPSATLRLRFSATAASVNAFTYLLNPGDTYESPTGEVYTGAIQGIWSAAVGAAQVTEF